MGLCESSLDIMPYLPVSAMDTGASQDWQSYTINYFKSILVGSSETLPNTGFFQYKWAQHTPTNSLLGPLCLPAAFLLISKTTLIIFLTLMANSDKIEIYSLSQSTWGVKVRPFTAPFHSFVSKVKQQQSFTLLCFSHDSSIHHGTNVKPTGGPSEDLK